MNIKKWCSLIPKTTFHIDADCCVNGALHPKEGNVHSAVVLGAHPPPSENDQKLANNFNGGLCELRNPRSKDNR